MLMLMLILEITVLGLLYLYAKGNYQGMYKSIQKETRLPAVFMIPILFIVDRFIVGKFISYERKLIARLSELYGNRDIKNRLRQYLIRKTAYLAVSLLAVTAVGALMDKPDAGYWIFSAAVFPAVFYTIDRELEEKIKKRNLHIQQDFPDFLNKLVLLINAGMTVVKAWEKIINDRKTMTPLYEELSITYLEIKNGKPEMSAYEDFARRCRVKEVTKFIAAVIQNLRKGNSELVPLLKLQANECWQLRKSMAKRLGEEASTKLVLPLMIMFVGILVIVLLPAVLQLKYL